MIGELVVETALSVLDVEFFGWKRRMTEGGSLATGCGEVVVHGDVNR